MSSLSLIFTIVFVFIALFLSKSFRIGLEKDIIIASIRAAVQLLVIGYVLSFIFDANHPAFMILILFLMLTVASQNVVKKKSRGLKLSFVYLSLFLL